MRLEELSISKEGGDNEEDPETEEWSETDKTIVTPSIELIKVNACFIYCMLSSLSLCYLPPLLVILRSN